MEIGMLNFLSEIIGQCTEGSHFFEKFEGKANWFWHFLTFKARAAINDVDYAVLVFRNEIQAHIFSKIIENNSLSSAAELQNHIAGILVEPEDPLCYLKTRLNFNFAPFTSR